MRKKFETRPSARQKLNASSQLELALTQREITSASVVQFPIKSKPTGLGVADAKHRLLKFAARLPD